MNLQVHVKESTSVGMGSAARYGDLFADAAALGRRALGSALALRATHGHVEAFFFILNSESERENEDCEK